MQPERHLQRECRERHLTAEELEELEELEVRPLEDTRLGKTAVNSNCADSIVCYHHIVKPIFLGRTPNIVSKNKRLNLFTATSLTENRTKITIIFNIRRKELTTKNKTF